MSLRLIVSAIIGAIGLNFALHLLTPIGIAFDTTKNYQQEFYVAPSFPYLRRYHIHAPTDIVPGQRLPLLIVLPGASQRSALAQIFGRENVQARQKMIVLVPQPAFNRVWATPGNDQQLDELHHVIELAQEVIQTHAVDPSRVYIAGASNGGIGTIAALARYPETFAAGFSYAGGWPKRETGALGSARLWAIHGADDAIIPPSYSKSAVSIIRELGGEAHLSVIPDQGHGFYFGPELSKAINWMMTQSIAK